MASSAETAKTTTSASPASWEAPISSAPAWANCRSGRSWPPRTRKT
jgi:hypothetical protein